MVTLKNGVILDYSGTKTLREMIVINKPIPEHLYVEVNIIHVEILTSHDIKLTILRNKANFYTFDNVYSIHFVDVTFYGSAHPIVPNNLSKTCDKEALKKCPYMTRVMKYTSSQVYFNLKIQFS